MNHSPHLIIVINEDQFLLSHRREIVVAALQEGWKVTIVTKNTGRRKEITELGASFVELPINPTGRNPIQELKTLWFLINLYRRNRDAIVHHVGIKNILWGSVAAKLANVHGVLNAVSGLGNMVFRNTSDIMTNVLSSMLGWGSRRRNIYYLFQNKEDRELFEEKGIIDSCYVRDECIRGSGVDLNIYSFSAEPDDCPLQIIYTGRMVRDKGIEDLIKAAEILRPQIEGGVNFILCGSVTDNPRSLDEKYLSNLTDGRYIKWVGFRDDIPDQLRKSAIMVFPSYYREGVPKSLLEASAIGRPIITCNTVGCKDTVVDGRNGLLVNPHDPEGLAEALLTLIKDKELRRRMGYESRKIAERDYDVRDVVSKHLDIYSVLLRGR